MNHKPKRDSTILIAALFVLLGIHEQTVFAQQSDIPLWEYSIVGPSNSASSIGKAETYKGLAVGTSPLTGPMKATTLPAALIPVRLAFPALPASRSEKFPTLKVVFDPTAV